MDGWCGLRVCEELRGGIVRVCMVSDRSVGAVVVMVVVLEVDVEASTIEDILRYGLQRISRDLYIITTFKSVVGMFLKFLAPETFNETLRLETRHEAPEPLCFFHEGQRKGC